VNGLLFGIAVILLLHGITELMQVGGIDAATVGIARIVTVVVIPTLAMYFIAEGASDTSAARAQAAGACVLGQMPSIGYVLTVVVAAVLGGSFTRRGRWLAAKVVPANPIAGPVLALLVAVLGAVVSGNLNVRSEDFLFSPSYLNAYLVGVAILLVVLGVLLNTATRESV
jgi:hypothetical protein